MNSDPSFPAGPTTTDEALAAFDAAAAIRPDFMIGTWRGSELPTGHKLDGLLDASGWWGKQFLDPETVHPLLFERHAGTALWALNPRFTPIELALRLSIPSTARPVLRWGVGALRPVLQTRKARARLRTTTYRGEPTATMVYDQIPVLDVFRKVANDVVIGAMDVRGSPRPYFFMLRRATGLTM